MKKELITATIALHPFQVALIKGLQSGKINLEKDSLREIAAKCEGKASSAQKAMHHINALTKLGVIQFINGQYIYIKR